MLLSQKLGNRYLRQLRIYNPNLKKENPPKNKNTHVAILDIFIIVKLFLPTNKYNPIFKTQTIAPIILKTAKKTVKPACPIALSNSEERETSSSDIYPIS